MRKNGNNELNRGTKKSFISFLPIIGAGLLAAGAIAGVGLSAWHVSQTYKESSEFSNSATARVKIDPVAFEVEGSKSNEQIAKDNAKLAAERLSTWLRDNGQDSYDVSYELEAPKTQGAQYFAYISAKFKINKVTSKHASDTDKVDNDPYLSIFESKGINSNNKSFVYRWYDQEHKAAPETAEPKYSVLNFSDLFVIPDKIESSNETKAMLDKDSKAGVVYKINEKNNDFLNRIYNDMLKYEADTKATSNASIDPKVQPRIYIINNLEGMFNEASYHITNWGYSVDYNARFTEYDRIYKDSDYTKFATSYIKDNWKTGKARTDIVKKLQSVQADDGKTSYTLENGDVFNILDAKTPGTLEHSAIFSKYVEDIIPFGKIKDYFKENIDDDKIKNTIPAKQGDDTKITYFWHAYSSKDAADNYIRTVVEKAWKKSKIVAIDLQSSAEWAPNYNQFINDYKTTIVAPKFTETLFGGNKLVGILSLGFLIYLVIIGILLACLYRMTGVFSWITMMFMLSMTGLIAVFGASSVISMSLLFGLFIMSIAGFITAFGICGRMKRRLLSNEDSQVIVSKTFKQSLWPAADTSIIALIFGICFTYIAPLGLNALGLVLIIGGFANFIGTYLFNGLLHALWFNNKITINHFGWFGPKHNNVANEALSQGRNDVPTTLDATKLNFSYYCRFSTKKLDVTNKRSIVALSVAAALLIAGVVLFLVLGFINTNMFHADNCLVITVTAQHKDNVLNWMRELGQNFTGYTSSKDGLVWYFYCETIGTDVVSQLISKGASSVWTQFVVGETSRDLLIAALFSIIIASSISTVYVAIRNNWTSFVPMLAAGMGLPLIVLGVSSVAQLMFDETVVLAYAMLCVVNSIVCVNIINSINGTWIRNEGYNKKELKFIVNESLKNDAFWLILVIIAYVLFIVAFGLSAPKGCLNITILLSIGMVVTIFFAPYVIAGLTYWFLVVRNAALRHKANRKARKVVVNYDEIDEQGIEGLNKFSKKIAIPKEEPINNEQK